VLWATLPALSIPLFAERYHPIYVDTVLPQLLGLTNVADFPSTIAVLVSAAFLLKGIEGRSHELVLLSALAAGFAIGIKPANLVFLAAPFLLLALARRPVQLLVFAAGLLPALATLALWKERGLGELPVIARPEAVLAGGGALVAAVGGLALDRYIDVDWGHLWLNLRQLQEVFWGIRVLEWFLIAGAVAVGRRSIPKAAFLVTWFGAYLVFKGASSAAIVQQGSFFRLVQPGLPVVVILAAACLLLVPSIARKAGASTTSVIGPIRGQRLTALAVGGAVLFGVLPFLVVALVRPVHEHVLAAYSRDIVVTPVNAFPLTATRNGPRVRLQWKQEDHHGTRAFYRVLRSEPSEGKGLLADVRDGLRCPSGDLPRQCTIFSDVIATTRGSIYVDRPPPGRWTYRIAVSANAYDSFEEGDVVLVSNGAVVTLP
jgi:hypothetical protein